MDLSKAKKCTINSLGYLMYAPNLHYCQDFYGNNDKVICKSLKEKMEKYEEEIKKCYSGDARLKK